MQGISITSGLFQLWREQGFINIIHLKYGACASLFGTLISLGGSYFHMHLSDLLRYVNILALRALASHHLSLLFGLGSISWCGHQVYFPLICLGFGHLMVSTFRSKR